MNVPVAAVFIVLVALSLLAGRRALDRRADDRNLKALVQGAGPGQEVFDPTMIEDLPDPAQRYFLYSIRVGAPLYRVVAEGAIWAPASLLPGDAVRWEPVDESVARAVVSFGRFEQAVDITVAEDGRPAW